MCLVWNKSERRFLRKGSIVLVFRFIYLLQHLLEYHNGQKKTVEYGVPAIVEYQDVDEDFCCFVYGYLFLISNMILFRPLVITGPGNLKFCLDKFYDPKGGFLLFVREIAMKDMCHSRNYSITIILNDGTWAHQGMYSGKVYTLFDVCFLLIHLY